MRQIESSQIIDTIAKMVVDANITLCDHVSTCIKNAATAETSPQAAAALDMIVKNMDVACESKMPLCQDTGMAVVFVRIGQGVFVRGSLEDAINEGVRRGYRDGYLRASVVDCPIRRKNTTDNTPAIIYYTITQGDDFEITVMPKGFGSENKGQLKMLVPSAGLEGVEDFVVECVRMADADPCPPIFVGVGIGGTMDYAALLAKQALCEIGSSQTDALLSESEARLTRRINELKIGAAGFGGDITVLGIRIKSYPTHIAGLPVAVNIGCHVSRHVSVRL